MTELDELRAEHQPDAIRLRLAAKKEHRYLGDAIFGAVDGSETTFAVVAGAVGAQLSGGVVTRRDADEFLKLAPRVPVRTDVEAFPLAEANDALHQLRGGGPRGAAVLMN